MSELCHVALGIVANMWNCGLYEEQCDLPPFSELMRLHLKLAQFWTSHYRKGIEGQECVQRRATELGKGLGHKSDKGQLRDVEVFSLESTQDGLYHCPKPLDRKL
ncbi:hypothetical protein TURU_015432 [Turdus rufiventris]|nr:hypothetical protein TURU_015432 [Turdus rufiventris]